MLGGLLMPDGGVCATFYGVCWPDDGRTLADRRQPPRRTLADPAVNAAPPLARAARSLPTARATRPERAQATGKGMHRPARERCALAPYRTGYPTRMGTVHPQQNPPPCPP